MSDSLLFSQLCRLLRSGEKKTLAHVFYWLGDLLENLAPNINHGQLRAAETPEYFAHIAELVTEMMISERVTAESINNT